MFLTDEDFQRPDWPLAQNGAVTLFRRREILSETIRSLTGLGYSIAHVGCDRGDVAFRRQVSAMLRWEDQFGSEAWNGNLDALNDGFRGFPFGSSHRSAAVFLDWHAIAAPQPERAHAILDIIEGAARDALLRGNLLLALVQTDDPRYQCASIGARHAGWNPRERLLSARGLGSG